MPEQPKGDEYPERVGDETTSHTNPPNAVVNRSARRTALFTYLGLVVAFFVVVGAALLFWAGTGAGPIDDPGREDADAIGTSGGRLQRDTPGGFDPAPDHDDTAAELEFRGAGEPSQGPMPALRGLDESADAAATGATIDLRDVEVERTEGNTIWIRDGNQRAAVTMRGEMPNVQAGQRVDVRGTIEAGGNEPRIRADRIDVR